MSDGFCDPCVGVLPLSSAIHCCVSSLYEYTLSSAIHYCAFTVSGLDEYAAPSMASPIRALTRPFADRKDISIYSAFTLLQTCGVSCFFFHFMPTISHLRQLTHCLLAQRESHLSHTTIRTMTIPLWRLTPNRTRFHSCQQLRPKPEPPPQDGVTSIYIILVNKERWVPGRLIGKQCTQRARHPSLHIATCRTNPAVREK